MNSSTSLIYDPLYRVIDDVGDFESVEGKFKWEFEKLKNIGNLGVIPRIYEMAEYPKYEHTIGVIHQISNLLKIADEETVPKRYRKPLRVASMFIHVGHLPFTFTTERALLIAAKMGDREEKNKIHNYILRRIRSAIGESSISEDRGKEIINDMFSLKRTKSLYRFFSADIVAGRKRDILSKNYVKEGRIKTVVDNIIDRSNDGYKFLELANKADYVQRDALYLGTVKIDLPPEHLYSNISRYDPTFGINEERLIDVNLKYLKDRFYDSDESIWFSGLLEKVFASMMLSSNFESEYVEDYGDSEFERLITERRDRENEVVGLPERWSKRAEQIFAGDIEFEKVFCVGNEGSPLHYDGDIIDLEYELLDKSQSKRGLLNYPFEDDILVYLDYEDTDTVLEDEHINTISIKLFRRKNSNEIDSILKVVSNTVKNIGFSGVAEIRKGVSSLLSETGYVRFNNSFGLSQRVTSLISRAVKRLEADDDSDIDRGSLLKDIREYQSFSQIWQSWENKVWLMMDGALLRDNSSLMDSKMYQHGFVTGLLSLPVKLLQYAAPTSFLRTVKTELLQMITEGVDQKGDIFEAVCLIDRLLNKNDSFQFFINGAIEVNPDLPKDDRDVEEHDIIELRYNDEYGSKIIIYECTSDSNFRSKDRQKLREFAEWIHDERFPNVDIHANHMIPKNKDDGKWEPTLEQAPSFVQEEEI